MAESSYQYGMRPASSREIILCATLEEALFYQRAGAELLFRKVTVTTGKWSVAPGKPPPEVLADPA